MPGVRLSWDKLRKIVNSFRSIRPPTTDDYTFPVPTIWVDEPADISYILLDVTNNVALWIEIVDADRVTDMENTNDRRTFFEEISTTSGTITKPTGSTIILDAWSEDIDALVLMLEVSGQQPQNIIPRDAAGQRVIVSSFDTLGAYTLSGTPVDRENNDTPYGQWAIAYVVDISLVNFKNADRSKLLT